MSGDFSLIWAVLGLPVIGFLIQSLFGKRLVAIGGKRLVGALAVLPILAAFGCAAVLTLNLSNMDPAKRSVVVSGPSWIETMHLSIPFEWVVDPLSMTMVLIITGIGGLIHLYATGYMSEERDYSRFFTYLNLFIVAMLILVLGNNLLLLFMGWEGVGLCSYLLIGFWYKDLANARAANKAFIVNRIGDWGLTLGIVAIAALLTVHAAPGMVYASGTSHLTDPSSRYLSYDVMLPLLGKLLGANPALTALIAALLFIGAAGKSAQFPLYLWLPDAMAGPTPVSALIHAATMVTSGVVLMNRMHIVFENAPVVSAIIAFLGAFTALFAAVIAFGQTDIKKVLAYSTVSQLGFMFIGCGAGAYWTGMFHVTTHAFFKALLFLGAGAVIHAMGHNQDMRNYGNLRKYLPITTFCMICGWIAICAVPFTSGSFSKESILGSAIAGEHAVIGSVNVGMFAGYLGLFVALLTSVYMTRLMWLTFFGKDERWRAIPAHGHHHDGADDESHALGDTALAHEAVSHVEAPAVAYYESHPEELSLDDPHGFYYTSVPAEIHEEHHDLDGEHKPREVSPSMWLPLVLLAVLSVGAGFFMAQNDAFEKWLYPVAPSIVGEVPHEVANLPMLSACAAIGGILLGIFFYRKGLPGNQSWDETKWARWRRSARDQFGFDNLATLNSVEGGGDLATGIWKFVDIGTVDGIVNGSGALAAWIGSVLKKAQSGYVRLYALVMLVGGVAFLGYFLIALRAAGAAGGVH